MAIWQASRPTVIDSRRAFWNEEFELLVLERVKDLIEDSDAVRSLPFHSSVCFAHETSKIFLFFFFCSRLPFRVFTLESFFFPFLFFLIHFFLLSYYALDNSKFIPNKWKIDQDFLLAEEKRQQPCWLWKISQGRNSSVQVSTFNQNGLFWYVM